MRIIPVIDVMNGVVVRAVAGRRSEYRPIQSALTRSTNPIDVARAMLDATGASELYVADLDAIIAGSATPTPAVKALIESNLCPSILLDCGVKDENTVYQHPLVRPVIGSETLTTFDATMPDALRVRNPLLSLDLQGSELIFTSPLEGEVDMTEAKPKECRVGGTSANPLNYAATMLDRGYRSFIAINLANVGMSQGTGTDELIHTMARWKRAPLEIYVGGGIRNRDDIDRLADLGVTGVLVSTAIHNRQV